MQTDGSSYLTHGPDHLPDSVRAGGWDVSARDDTRVVAAVRGASASDVVCAPAGTRRLVLVYAIPFDGADRYPTHAPQLRRATYEASAVIDNESRSVAPTMRKRLRVACDADGTPSVVRARLRTGTATATFTTVQRDILAERDQIVGSGYDHYAVFYDADLGSYRGIATYYNTGIQDPDASNPSNHGTSFALQDSSDGRGPDWPTMLHEIGHTMGAVGDGAPHATGGSHCTDGLDVMCYDDGASRGNAYSASVCTARTFDCGHDDYFNPAPAAGYLTTHWNVASVSNGYLEHDVVPPDTTPPPAPHGLTAEPHGRWVRLRWQASSEDSTRVAYRILSRTPAGEWDPVGDAWPGQTERVLATTPAEHHTYAVQAFDARGNRSAPSEALPVTTGADDGWEPAPGPDDPDVVTGLHVAAITQNTAELRWEVAPEGPTVAYQVLQQDAAGWTPVATTSAPRTSVTGLQPASTRRFAVRGVDAEGRRSAPVEVVVATPGDAAAASPPPVSQLEAITDGGAVTLRWSAVSGASSYRVYRLGEQGADKVALGTTTATSFQATGLGAGSAARRFAVTARGATLVESDLAEVAPAPPQPVDASPPRMMSHAVHQVGSTSIAMAWQEAADNVGVTAYQVLLRRPGEPWQVALTVPPAQRSATVTGLTPQTTYHLHVAARDAAGYSGITGTYWTPTTTPADSVPPAPAPPPASAAPPSPPPAPSEHTPPARPSGNPSGTASAPSLNVIASFPGASPPIGLTQTPDRHPPRRPRGLECFGAPRGTIELRWLPGVDDRRLIRLEVEVRRLGTRATALRERRRVVRFGATRSSGRIRRVTPRARYALRARWVDAAGNRSPWSARVIARTR